jgi:hypothetical protein
MSPMSTLHCVVAARVDGECLNTSKSAVNLDVVYPPRFPSDKTNFPPEQCYQKSSCFFMLGSWIALKPQNILLIIRWTVLFLAFYYSRSILFTYVFIMLVWSQAWHLPRSVVWMCRWVIAKSTHEAATTVTQCVIDLRLGKLAITSRTQTQVRCL